MSTGSVHEVNLEENNVTMPNGNLKLVYGRDMTKTNEQTNKKKNYRKCVLGNNVQRED